MELSTPRIARRSTRVRVEIPVMVTSLDRLRPFAEKCVVLVVSAQGCGFRSSQALQIGTPVLLSELPAGSGSGRVANCLPLGEEGKQFLIGVALYNHGNVWGVADPPDDWNITPESAAAAHNASAAHNKQTWPYNLFTGSGEGHPRR